MEISVYASKDFANENSKLHKCNKITRYDKDKGIQNNIDMDRNASITLKELYADGWTIKTLDNPFSNVTMFFMERN